MTIELNPEQARMIDLAIAAGLIDTADDVVKAGLESIRSRLRAQEATESAEEWMRRFRAWAHSHPTDTPLLTDEALTRESIYGDRGL
jgi:Arc/MetJ-type ribon-helix-helix transcriptional regulator